MGTFGIVEVVLFSAPGALPLGQIVIDDEHDLLSCSIGASIYPTDFVRRTELYAAADQALYAAKQRGTGLGMFYDQLPQSE